MYTDNMVSQPTAVAIKELHVTPKVRLGDDKRVLDTILNEVSVMAQLSHKNIVALLGVIYTPESTFPSIIMEYVSGGSLSLLLRDSGEQLSIAQKLDIAVQICSGVEYIHDCGIVHCDLATRNCLVTASTLSKNDRIESGRDGLGSFAVKISDFGMAHSVRTSENSKPIEKLNKARGTFVQLQQLP